jgi:hypothetical protein
MSFAESGGEMSFLVAVLLGALLLGERLGPPPEMRRRLYQVVLGITLFLFAIGIQELALPGPDVETQEVLDFGRDSDEELTSSVSERLRERTTFVVAMGLGLLVVGLVKAAEWGTSHLGLMLSGLLLLVSSLVDSVENSFPIYSLSSSYLVREAGSERNAIYAMVLGVGALCLFLYGFNHWDKVQAGAETRTPDV